MPAPTGLLLAALACTLFPCTATGGGAAVAAASASRSNAAVETEAKLISAALRYSHNHSVSKEDLQATLKNLHERRNLPKSGGAFDFEGIKVFVADHIRPAHAHADCALPNIPGAAKIRLPAGSPLGPVSDWLWRHSEYVGHEWIDQWLACRATVVKDAKDADLCYPTCYKRGRVFPDSVIGRWKAQQMVFQVHNHGRFMGCSHLSFNMERLKGYTTLCDVVVPYFHGIYAPRAAWSVAPWSLGLKRDNFLGFFGSSQRGGRAPLIVQMLKHSFVHSANSTYATLFRAPSQTENIMNNSIAVDKLQKSWRAMMVQQDARIHGADEPFVTAWELYATSTLCFQPPGDSPTRRAFYDSLMFGCVPVTSKRAAESYNHLFNGRLLQARGLNIDDVAVVLEDSAFKMWGNEILVALLAIPAEEIARLRQNAATIAPHLQWSWSSSAHVLKTFFAAVSTTAEHGPAACVLCGARDVCREPARAACRLAALNATRMRPVAKLFRKPRKHTVDPEGWVNPLPSALK